MEREKFPHHIYEDSQVVAVTQIVNTMGKNNREGIIAAMKDCDLTQKEVVEILGREGIPQVEGDVQVNAYS